MSKAYHPPAKPELHDLDAKAAFAPAEQSATDENLSTLISKAVAAKMTPAFIEKEVDSRVEKLVVECIDKAFRSYSDLSKMIEAAVSEALAVGRLDLPSYGSVISSMLKAQIEATVAPLVAGRLAADMEELLSLAPKQVKLSKIAEEMLQYRRDYGGDAWGDVITVHLQRSDYGSAWLYLDDEAHHDSSRAQYDSKYRLLISKDGTISSATIGDRRLFDARHIGASYGLEQKIRAWVACGTAIELDEDFVSISLGDD